MGEDASEQRSSRRESLERLLTVEEVAELLRIKVSTVYAWAASGKVPCVRLGSRVRFLRGDLSKWIGARKEG